MEAKTEQFLTPEEVADLLKVSRQAVYNWLTSGELTGYKAGASWRIKRLDVDDFLKSNKNKAN